MLRVYYGTNNSWGGLWIDTLRSRVYGIDSLCFVFVRCFFVFFNIYFLLLLSYFLLFCLRGPIFFCFCFRVSPAFVRVFVRPALFAYLVVGLCPICLPFPVAAGGGGICVFVCVVVFLFFGGQLGARLCCVANEAV